VNGEMTAKKEVKEEMIITLSDVSVSDLWIYLMPVMLEQFFNSSLNFQTPVKVCHTPPRGSGVTPSAKRRLTGAPTQAETNRGEKFY